MNQTLSTTALVLHDIGLAAGFGGTLFGKVALDPMVKVIASREDRGKIVNAAWGTYNLFNSAALGVAALSWLIGRTGISGKRFGQDMRRHVVAKDILMGATVATGLITYALGLAFARQAKNAAVPVETGMTAALETPTRAAALQKAIGATGFAHLAAVGAVIAETAILNMKAGRSMRWGAFARALP